MKKKIEDKIASLQVVAVYKTGKELLNGIKEDKAALYILDIQLGSTTGYELGNKIFLETGKMPRVIFITGEPEQQDIDMIYKSNAIVVDFILRPFSDERIVLMEKRINATL